MNYFKSLIHKVQTARALSWSEWGILVKAWIWLLYMDLLLRNRSFPRVQQVVGNQQRPKRQVSAGQEWNAIYLYQRFTTLAARYHLYQMTCLRQALALQVLLGGQGISTKLRFGVRKESVKLLAHAWLEYEGQSIEVSGFGSEYFEQLASLGESA
jgi:hypothetical protein